MIACKKLHMKEMFTFRNHLDTLVDQSEETLHKVRPNEKFHLSLPCFIGIKIRIESLLHWNPALELFFLIHNAVFWDEPGFNRCSRLATDFFCKSTPCKWLGNCPHTRWFRKNKVQLFVHLICHHILSFSWKKSLTYFVFLHRFD